MLIFTMFVHCRRLSPTKDTSNWPRTDGLHQVGLNQAGKVFVAVNFTARSHREVKHAETFLAIQSRPVIILLIDRRFSARSVLLLPPLSFRRPVSSSGSDVFERATCLMCGVTYLSPRLRRSVGCRRISGDHT